MNYQSLEEGGPYLSGRTITKMLFVIPYRGGGYSYLCMNKINNFFFFVVAPDISDDLKLNNQFNYCFGSCERLIAQAQL